MKKLELPSQETLLRLLSYNRESGKLYWKMRAIELFDGDNPSRHQASWNTRYAGKEALKCIDTHGYKTGAINGHQYQAHRVVWKIIHGADPICVDHIDGDTTNNRPHNLRSITHSSNLKNTKQYKNNSSGVSGVSWNRHSKRWRASIWVDMRCIHLGYFADLREAAKVRKRAEAKYGYHKNHGRTNA